MINHVVLFKLKNYDTEIEKQSVLREIKSKLENLKLTIPELQHIEVGLNYELQAASFDLCLISHFKSIADLDAYRVHPDHVEVAGFMSNHVVGRAAVDYNF